MSDVPRLHGRKFGLMLCDALGLDKNNVSRIEIIADVDQPATAIVTTWIRNDAGERIGLSLMTEYEITETGS